jgi:aldehyde dehydrogenase (NAD+)
MMHLKPNHPSVGAAGRTLIGFNIINGREIEGDLGLIEARSAADSRDVVGLFPDSGPKDIERAAKAAAEAFGPWSRSSAKHRGKILESLARILSDQQRRLAGVLTRETGLTPGEALGEVQLVVDACLQLAGFGKKPFAAKGKKAGAQEITRPMGVVGILSSRTTPLAWPGRKLLAALFFGNTVVWKPSDGAPSTAYLLLRALQEAGMPPGVVNSVNGKGRSGCGKHFIAAVDKGCFQMFCFAGSLDLGRTIGETCGRNLVPADLETGGRNPMLVMADADLDQAVRTALLDAFAAAGQRGTSLGNILLHSSVASPFTERFLEGVSALRCGNPVSHPDVDYGPMLNLRFAEAFRHHWDAGRREGAKLLHGGSQWTEDNRTARVEGEIGKGAYMQPCVWSAVAPQMALFRDEVYGPTVNLCTVESFAQALDLVNAAPQGAVGSLFSHDSQQVKAFRSEARVGSLSINAPLVRACPLSLDSWTRTHAVREEAMVDERPANETAEALPVPAPVNWGALD